MQNSCSFVFIRGKNSCIKSFRVTSFAPREAMTTAEQTEAYSTSCAYCLLLMADGIWKMADVCEAFCLFCVICGLPKIRVHSCSFVVHNQ